VKHASVLDVDPRTDADRGYIAANRDVVHNGHVVAQVNVAADVRSCGDEHAGSDLGRCGRFHGLIVMDPTESGDRRL
jgi:hypothetical protein